MGIFISRTPVPPYRPISSDTSDPLILIRTIPERDATDEDLVRCYLVAYGENFKTISITSEATPTGIMLLFAKDNGGVPDVFKPVITYSNVLAADENKDIVIPFYVKLSVVERVINVCGPYIKVEYELL